VPETLRIEDCANAACPWSGKPVRPGNLTLYRSKVVGFFNPGCRDKFVAVASAFDGALAANEGDRP